MRFKDDFIFSDNVPAAEVVFFQKSSHTVHTGYWGLLPFARGNVHISSADPISPPKVNPNYGMLDWDVQVQIGMSKFLRRMFQTGDMGDIVSKETLPGLEIMPTNALDENWKRWLGEQCRWSHINPLWYFSNSLRYSTLPCHWDNIQAAPQNGWRGE